MLRAYALPTPLPVLYLSFAGRSYPPLQGLQDNSGTFQLDSQSTRQAISLEVSDFRSMWRRCKQISVLSGGAGVLFLRNYMSFGEDLHPSNLVESMDIHLACFRYWNSLFHRKTMVSVLAQFERFLSPNFVQNTELMRRSANVLVTCNLTFILPRNWNLGYSNLVADH
jgi:hypothetical protein